MDRPSILENSERPYLGNGSSDALRLWFQGRGRVFKVGRSNGPTSGCTKSKIQPPAILENFEWPYLWNGLSDPLSWITEHLWRNIGENNGGVIKIFLVYVETARWRDSAVDYGSLDVEFKDNTNSTSSEVCWWHRLEKPRFLGKVFCRFLILSVQRRSDKTTTQQEHPIHRTEHSKLVYLNNVSYL